MKNTTVILETGTTDDVQFILTGLNESLSAQFGVLPSKLETVFQKTETVPFERSVMNAVDRAYQTISERTDCDECVYIARRGMTLTEGNYECHLSPAIISVVKPKKLIRAHFYPHDEEAPALFDFRIGNIRAAVAQLLPLGWGDHSESERAKRIFQAVEQGFLLSDQMMKGAPNERRLN